MSDLEIAISRLTAWVRDHGDGKAPAFMADLGIVLLAAKDSLRSGYTKVVDAEAKENHMSPDEIAGPRHRTQTGNKTADIARKAQDAYAAMKAGYPPQSLEDYVQTLIDVGAVHKRKGTTLGKESWTSMVHHLQEEVREFAQAVYSHNTTHDDKVAELGDILGIVIHAALKLGVTMAAVERREIEKLKERFTIPAKATPEPPGIPCKFKDHIQGTNCAMWECPNCGAIITSPSVARCTACTKPG